MEISPQAHNFAVQIIRYVDGHEPGWVECEFTDAEGRKHRIIDKVPIFTARPLDSASKYPQPGHIRCEVLRKWQDASGRELVQVSTATPDDVESTERLSEFVVLSSLLLDEA